MTGQSLKRLAHKVSLIVSMIILVGCSQNEINTTKVAKDVVLIVIPDESDSCKAEVSFFGSDNCKKVTDCDTSDCVCEAKDKKITWYNVEDKKFKLKFDSQSPFKNQCGESFKKKKISCKVDESVRDGDIFTYKIFFESCSDATDPRIIIRPRN